MKILVLCYEYPPIGGGGGRVAESLSESLVRKGHFVRVQTAGMKHLPDSEVRNGVEISRSQSFRKKEDTCSVLEMALYLFTSFLPSFQIASKWKPDILHIHFAVPTGVLGLAVNFLTRIPYVLTAHLGDVPGGVPEQTQNLFRFVKPFTNMIWKHAAKTTAVSSFVAELAYKAYGVQPEVILNGVRQHSPPAIKGQTPTRLLLVGRLSVQKNPLLALRALARLKNFSWQLDVVGDGPLGPEMRHLTEELGIRDRVIDHGWQEVEGVKKLMSEAEILLMPSLHEGLPVAAIEAMQNGLAVIGSRIGGLQDIIEDGGNGFFADLTEIDFAEKIQLLLLDPQLLLQMRRASLERVRFFNLETITSSYERVFFDAMENRGA